MGVFEAVLNQDHQNHPGCRFKLHIPEPTLDLLSQNLKELELGKCPFNEHSHDS